MLDSKQLVKDLQRLMKKVEADLKARVEAVPGVGKNLKEEYERAREAKRTGETWLEWRDDVVTQHAAAWVLSCVFARFLEDNGLIEPPRIAGPGEALRRAQDEYELYFRGKPKDTDREYLLSVFREIGRLPGGREVFGEKAAVFLRPGWLGADMTREMLEFLRKRDATTGLLAFDFTDPDWNTRFLGDLYQDLSEHARKKYALLQTPEFVEEFILDRTLDPAIEEFGLEGFRMIDPACGSGHFLLGSFRRVFERWLKKEPGTNVRVLVQRSLESANGVDLNPFAAAIARFRLLLAAMRACGIKRLKDAPAFSIRVEAGDSLLHGAPLPVQENLFPEEYGHFYQEENREALRAILKPGHYHAVVANPPYITVKDRSLRENYRARYETCFQKFSLSVPFLERIVSLCICSGFTGQITANSFMKREFGKVLIERFLPRIDLTHVIDMSGAYVPGHGTPTVILFARNRAKPDKSVRTVFGIKGEPSTPGDPSRGLVWTSIVSLVDRPGTSSEYVSASDSPVRSFHTHPWSIGGGGATDLKAQIESACRTKLSDAASSVGITSVTGEDDVYLLSDMSSKRRGLSPCKPVVVGDEIRDWSISDPQLALWVYASDYSVRPIDEMHSIAKYLWAFKRSISQRKRFGVPMLDKGLAWYQWQELYPSKFSEAISIAFAFVATHNHFVLDRGGKVFNRSAPLIKLKPGATEDDHYALLGLLNSSTACFWMKQVFHNKGSTVDQHGARQRTVPFEDFWEYDGTKIKQMPIPEKDRRESAKRMTELVDQCRSLSPESLVAALRGSDMGMLRAFEHSKVQAGQLRLQMIALQEEMDWEYYKLFGIAKANLAYSERTPQVALGERAFEIVLARKAASGEEQTTWFDRHRSKPITEIPKHWPTDYQELVARRIKEIETNPNVRLIEKPEYKRRWAEEPWEDRVHEALQQFLLAKLEALFDFDGRMNDDGVPTGVIGVTAASIKSQVAGPDASRADTAPCASPGGSPSHGDARDGASVGRGSSRAETAHDEAQGGSPGGSPYQAGDEGAGVVGRGSSRADPRCAARVDARPTMTSLSPELVSVARIADLAAKDAKFMEAAEIYVGRPDFDVLNLVTELVESESVPLLPVLRYKDTGLEKRAEWEHTWDLQRQEDALEAQLARRGEGEKGGKGEGTVGRGSSRAEAPADPRCAARVDARPTTGDAQALAAEKKRLGLDRIPVPPKYVNADFKKPSYWRLRGKLDVPKERWVSFPHCEGPDGSLVVAWAGYDHLQLARAVSAWYVKIKEEAGGTEDPRLPPLLACLLELLPWLKQWHNDIDPEFNLKMGDYFENFVREEARSLNLTTEQLSGWRPKGGNLSRNRRRANGEQ